MARFFREEDGDTNLLKQKKVALIGYGNMGRALALNLRDSGIRAVVGNVEDIYAERARADGFDVMSIDRAAQGANVMLMLVSDEVMPRIYLEMIAPTLKRGDALVFAAAYNVAFGFIEPPAFVDVVMVAPRMVSAGVRERFLKGEGFLSFVGVERDASGAAWETALAVAKAVGSLKAGALAMSFEQEAELDLFVQQGFMTALYQLLNITAAMLVERGYPPEAVCAELYLSGELAYIIEKAGQVGLAEQAQTHSLTAQYGVLARYEHFSEPKFKRQMMSILEEIRDGTFAQNWANEYSNGYPRLKEYLERLARWPTWEMERRTMKLLAGEASAAHKEEDTQRRY
ncbi:MAG: ketol-acid reductoisomerase [Anaerolineae bacterium]|nr:ketol-acid reductoisomerase [Anaerolineae bacterium]